MFLFGEEVGAQKDFIYNNIIGSREDLQMERNNAGQRLFRFYRDMIRLRLDNESLPKSMAAVI